MAGPGARLRAARGPDLRALRRGTPDHRPPVARGPGQLRGSVPRRPRLAAARAGPEAERGPADARAAGTSPPLAGVSSPLAAVSPHLAAASSVPSPAKDPNHISLAAMR